MARRQGTFSIGSNIEPNVSAPLDARLVCQTKGDLLDAASFPYSYLGMQVAVVAEGKSYILIAADTTKEASWKEVGTGAEITVDDHLDDQSINPVQNKVLTEKFNKIVSIHTTAEWEQLNHIVSVVGEIYVYSDYKEDEEGNPIPGIKMGDGNAYIVDLPFVTAEDARITQEDIDNWNNKVAVRVDGDRLIFY